MFLDSAHKSARIQFSFPTQKNSSAAQFAPAILFHQHFAFILRFSAKRKISGLLQNFRMLYENCLVLLYIRDLELPPGQVGNGAADGKQACLLHAATPPSPPA